MMLMPFLLIWMLIALSLLRRPPTLFVVRTVAVALLALLLLTRTYGYLSVGLIHGINDAAPVLSGGWIAELHDCQRSQLVFLLEVWVWTILAVVCTCASTWTVSQEQSRVWIQMTNHSQSFCCSVAHLNVLVASTAAMYGGTCNVYYDYNDWQCTSFYDYNRKSYYLPEKHKHRAASGRTRQMSCLHAFKMHQNEYLLTKTYIGICCRKGTVCRAVNSGPARTGLR